MRFWRTDGLWLALTGLLLLLAVWWFPGMGSITTDSYSVSHTGKKVFYQAARRLNGQTARSTNELIPRSDTWDRILILGPTRSPTDAEWAQLYSEVFHGATLVYAARFRDAPVDTGPFQVQVVSSRTDTEEKNKKDDEKETEKKAEKTKIPAEKSKTNSEKSLDASEQSDKSDHPGTSDAKSNTDVKEDDSKAAAEEDDDPSDWFSRDFAAQTELVPGSVTWKTEGFLKFPPANWEVLLEADDKPQVIRRELGDGFVVLLASDEIFSNAAMLEPERALLAFRILESAPAYGATWFDETLNSSGTPKVLGILFDPVFRPLTLQLLLIAILFGWSGSHRFGPLRQRNDTQRRSVVEHAQALGILYFRARAGAHAVQCMREYLNLELRRLYGTTFRVDNAAAVSHLVQMEESEVRELFEHSHEASAGKLSAAGAARLLKRYSALISRLRARRDAAHPTKSHPSQPDQSHPQLKAAHGTSKS